MTHQPISVNMFILMENDIAKAVAFYQNFGLKLNFHSSNRWAEFDINGVKMGLAQTSQELPERRTGIVLEVSDVHEFYLTHKDSGIEFLSEPVEAVHGIILSFRDPGNNILDLYQPTPEKLKAAIKKAAEEAEKNAGCCQSPKNDKKSCCND